MKKILCILMACLIFSLSLTGVSFAEETGTSETTTVLADTFTRTGIYGGTNYGSDILVIDAAGRKTYFKFDISTLRTAMGGKDAKYTLQFATNGDNNNRSATDAYIYGITGIDWAEDKLTYDLAVDLGLDTNVSNKIGEITLLGKNTTFTVDVTDYIQSLPETTNEITIKFEGKADTGIAVLASKEKVPASAATITATRTYAEGTEAVFDGINIPLGATENITLPTVGSVYGSSISWSSSHPNVIGADGTVTRQSGEVVVTLTAIDNDYSDNRKSFDVIVPAAEEETKAVIDVAEDTVTRSGANQYAVQGSNILVVDSSRTTYLKFNVSKLRKTMNGKDAKYKLQFTSHNTENKKAGTIYVYGISGANRTGWSDDTLTHYLASTNGLHDDVSNLLGKVYVSGKNVTFTVDVTDYILSIPEDGIATLKIQNTATDAAVIVLQSSESAVSDAARPKLIAERTYTDDYSGGINPKIYVNGNVATELSEGVATARVAFVGSDVTDAPKGTLVLALYNGDALKDIEFTSMTFSQNYVNDMSVSLDIPSGEDYSVRAFLLSDFDTLVPLTEYAEVE